MALSPLELSLGISPYSSATSGLDMFGDNGGVTLGGVNFGNQDSPATPIVRDAVTVVVVALAAAFVWKKWVRQ